MADNITYSGTGSSVPTNTVQRTDDLGAAGHVPYVKIMDGTDGASGVIGGDAANGLDVDVTRLPALPAGTNNIGDVDIASLPNEGQQTMANSISVAVASDQSAVPVSGTVSVTEPVSVDDNAGSLTVDAPTGTPVNVQVGDGTRQATVRDTGASDSLNVAIVDASGNQITSFGGGTQYVEDDAAPANPTGTLPVLVRDDTPNTQVTTDGDIVAQRGTNYGAAYVQVVTSAGAFVDAFGGSGGTAQADESSFTEGTTNMTPIGGVLNDTITSDPTEDQAAAVRITAKRALHANLRNVGGTEIGTSSAPVRTDPTGTTTQPVSDASGSLTVDAADGTVFVRSSAAATFPVDVGRYGGEVVPTLGTSTYTEATSRGLTIAAVRRDADTSPVGTDNEFGPLTMDANGRLKVEVFDGGDSHTVDGTVAVSSLPALVAGTANIGDVDVLSIAAGDNNIGNVDVVTMPNVTLAAGTNTNEVVGDVAHDIAAAGNPILNAGVSVNMDDTAPPNRVDAESDATRLATDRDGALFAHPHGPQVWSYHSDGSSALTDATVHAAPGAGLSLYVTDIVCSTGAATALNIFFEEGASKVLGPWYLEAVAGRGLAIHFGTPKKITANTALTVTTSAAIAHSVDVTGFVGQG